MTVLLFFSPQAKRGKQDLPDSKGRVAYIPSVFDLSFLNHYKGTESDVHTHTHAFKLLSRTDIHVSDGKRRASKQIYYCLYGISAE